MLVFKESPVLVRSGLTKAIGQPRELEKNLDDPSYFEREVDLSLPVVAVVAATPLKVATPVKQERESIGTIRTEPSTEVAQVAEVSRSDRDEEMKERIRKVVGDVNEIHYTPIKSLNSFN